MQDNMAAQQFNAMAQMHAIQNGAYDSSKSGTWDYWNAVVAPALRIPSAIPPGYTQQSYMEERAIARNQLLTTPIVTASQIIGSTALFFNAFSPDSIFTNNIATKVWEAGSQIVGRGVGSVTGSIAGKAVEFTSSGIGNILRSAANTIGIGVSSTGSAGTPLLNSLGEKIVGWTGSSTGGTATFFRDVGTTLQKGNVVSSTLGKVTKLGVGATAGLASSLVLGFIDPITIAASQAISTTLDYGRNAYENLNLGWETEKELIAKSGRILEYGSAHSSAGLAGGLTSVERANVIDKLKRMAALDASKSDFFRLGSWSPFGGHQKYTENLKELKAILSVGTDFGMFDASGSFSEFEKRFTDMVKVVKRMSKFLQKSEGEVASALAQVRQSTGYNNMAFLGSTVASHGITSMVTGRSAQEVYGLANAVTQFSTQNQLGGALGHAVTDDVLRLIQMAKNDSDPTYKLTASRMLAAGGENAIFQHLAMHKLTILKDPAMVTQLAMLINDRTGTWDQEKLSRFLNANTAAEREVYRQKRISYGKYNDYFDISNKVGNAFIDGNLDTKTVNDVLTAMIYQSIDRNRNISPRRYKGKTDEEVWIDVLNRQGMSRSEARATAKHYLGGYNEKIKEANAQAAKEIALNKNLSIYTDNNWILPEETSFTGFMTSIGTGALMGLKGGALGSAIGAVAGGVSYGYYKLSDRGRLYRAGEDLEASLDSGENLLEAKAKLGVRTVIGYSAKELRERLSSDSISLKGIENSTIYKNLIALNGAAAKPFTDASFTKKARAYIHNLINREGKITELPEFFNMELLRSSGLSTIADAYLDLNKGEKLTAAQASYLNAFQNEIKDIVGKDAEGKDLIKGTVSDIIRGTIFEVKSSLSETDQYNEWVGQASGERNFFTGNYNLKAGKEIVKKIAAAGGLSADEISFLKALTYRSGRTTYYEYQQNMLKWLKNTPNSMNVIMQVAALSGWGYSRDQIKKAFTAVYNEELGYNQLPYLDDVVNLPTFKIVQATDSPDWDKNHALFRVGHGFSNFGRVEGSAGQAAAILNINRVMQEEKKKVFENIAGMYAAEKEQLYQIQKQRGLDVKEQEKLDSYNWILRILSDSDKKLDESEFRQLKNDAEFKNVLKDKTYKEASRFFTDSFEKITEQVADLAAKKSTGVDSATKHAEKGADSSEKSDILSEAMQNYRIGSEILERVAKGLHFLASR